MEYQDIRKHLKINKQKSIGEVILIVEGEKDEFMLLEKIFNNIFDYNVISKRRNEEFKELVSSNNSNSRVIILNTKNSNIGSIKNTNYRDKLFEMIYLKYNIDLKNKRVYYIWDRDFESNTYEEVNNLILSLKNPFDNDNYESGLLLLNYPSIEAYTITNFEENKLLLDMKAKKYLKLKKYDIKNIKEETIKRAVKEMFNTFKYFKINEFLIDNIASVNKEILDKEEKFYKNNQTYVLLSLISVIFLDLGLLTWNEKNI